MKKNIKERLNRDIELSDEVNESINNAYYKIRNESREKNRFGIKLLLINAATLVLIIIGSGAVFAAGYSSINSYIKMNRPDNNVIDESSIHYDILTEPDDFVVDEVYIDGTYLYYTVHMSEGTRVILNSSSDHALVNGMDCISEGLTKVNGSDNQYFGSIKLYDPVLGVGDMERILNWDRISVQTTLYVKDGEEEYKKRMEFEFDINEDTQRTKSVSEQNFLMSDKVSITANGTYSPTMTMITLRYSVPKEDGIVELNKALAYYFRICDQNGKDIKWEGSLPSLINSKMDDIIDGKYGESLYIDDSTDSLVAVFSFSITDDVESITVVPYGKRGFDDEEIANEEEWENPHEDMAFTIKIK